MATSKSTPAKATKAAASKRTPAKAAPGKSAASTVSRADAGPAASAASAEKASSTPKSETSKGSDSSVRRGGEDSKSETQKASDSNPAVRDDAMVSGARDGGKLVTREEQAAAESAGQDPKGDAKNMPKGAGGKDAPSDTPSRDSQQQSADAKAEADERAEVAYELGKHGDPPKEARESKATPLKYDPDVQTGPSVAAPGANERNTSNDPVAAQSGLGSVPGSEMSKLSDRDGKAVRGDLFEAPNGSATVRHAKEQVWEEFTYPGTKETFRRLLLAKGQVVSLQQAEAIMAAVKA